MSTDRSKSHDRKRSKSDPVIDEEEKNRRALPFAERLSCTVDEACAATGLGRTKLYELIGSGEVATTTVGSRRLVIVRSLIALLDPAMAATDT